eukprot:gene24246-9842_t
MTAMEAAVGISRTAQNLVVDISKSGMTTGVGIGMTAMEATVWISITAENYVVGISISERWARCHRHGGARFSSDRSGVAVALTTHVAQPTASQDAEQATTGQWALARWRQGVTGCASRSTQGVLPGGATRQEVDLTTDP